MENKKLGFTLAEVLITLGIIGVVAAMSAPALVQHAAAAKTGPALSRAVSSLANGLQALLFTNDANKIYEIGEGHNTPVGVFGRLAGTHVKMQKSRMDAKKILSNGGSDADVVIDADNLEVYQFGDRSAILLETDATCNFKDDEPEVGDAGGKISGCRFFVAPIGWASKDNGLVLGDDVFELAYDSEGNIHIYGLEYGYKWNTDEANYTCKDPDSLTVDSNKKSCGGRIASMNYKKDY